MRRNNLNEANDPGHSTSPVLVRRCSWAAATREPQATVEIISSAFCCTAITIRAVLAILTRPGRRTLRYRSPACCDAAGCPGASTGRWRMHKKRRVSPICSPEIDRKANRFELSSFSPLFADKILLTSLPCRYRGELTPKPSGSQFF